MTLPLAFGRRPPLDDSELDDGMPKPVTCVDNAGGRAVAWSTGLVDATGKTPKLIDKDGTVYRHAISPPDFNGITLEQIAQAIHSVTGLHAVIPSGWVWGTASSWLMQGNGLIGIGQYDALPLADRYQVNGNFAHGLFFCYRSLTSGVRTYDALVPPATPRRYGRWLNAGHVRAFLESGADSNGHLQVAYVPLQHL